MLSKFLNCGDKQWKDCCYKFREQPYKCFICKVVIQEKDGNYHMSKQFKLCCSICKLNKQFLILGSIPINADYVFINIDIDLSVLVDLKSI